MIRLRPYRDSDAETVLSWCNSEDIFYKWTAGILGEYPLTRERFSSVCSLMAFVAVDDDQVVGFFTMRNPGEDFSELRFGFVIVDPARRGQGCGKTMLQLGLRYAKEIWQAERVSLGVFENNMAAWHCYRAAGFLDVKTEQTESYRVLGEEWRCLEMLCIL